MLARRRAGAPAPLAEVLEGCSPGRVPPAWAWLARVGPPGAGAGGGQRVLFAWGERDGKFAAVGAEVARRGGAGVRAREIKGAGHAVLEEAPEAAADAVAAFLAETSEAGEGEGEGEAEAEGGGV